MSALEQSNISLAVKLSQPGEYVSTMATLMLPSLILLCFWPNNG